MPIRRTEMTLTPDQAKNIAFKIKALFSKTTDNGATEDEAFAAVAKARELMDKYSIDFSALDMKAEGVINDVVHPYSQEGLRAALVMANAIGRYTETKVWVPHKRNFINYLGLVSDVLFAQWLNASLLDFIERKCVEYMHVHSFGTRFELQARRVSFFVGAANNISTRLNKAAAEREKLRGVVTGNALVLVTKKSLITEEMARMGLALGKGRNSNSTIGDSMAHGAGHRAGEGARWDKPINDSGKVFQLK